MLHRSLWEACHAAGDAAGTMAPGLGLLPPVPQPLPEHLPTRGHRPPRMATVPRSCNCTAAASRSRYGQRYDRSVDGRLPLPCRRRRCRRCRHCRTTPWLFTPAHAVITRLLARDASEAGKKSAHVLRGQHVSASIGSYPGLRSVLCAVVQSGEVPPRARRFEIPFPRT